MSYGVCLVIQIVLYLLCLQSPFPLCYRRNLRAVFSKSRAGALSPHRPYDCSIDLLPGTTPPRGRLFALSAPEREALIKYLSESLAAGTIVPSSSPASAGCFFVKKKDGSLRPCIDYHGLNEITIKNKYPLPLMSTAFDILQEARIFIKLDLRNAYHLVRIKAGDEWKSAFNTPFGHFEYQVLPFGLVNAPAVFQALINDVLCDMLYRFVFVYLDDILIFFTRFTYSHPACTPCALTSVREPSFLSRQRNAIFILALYHFSGILTRLRALVWTPPSFAALPNGPFLSLASLSSVSWDFLTFIVALSVTLARLLLLSWH